LPAAGTNKIQVSSVAKSWTIDGISEQTREAVLAVAKQAGMPAAIWVEQALQKALEEGLDPGVSIEEIEARIREVVAMELQPVREALARLEAAGVPVAPAAPAVQVASPAVAVSPVSLMRERMQQRRGR
jgi:hypothetical protein